MLSVGPLVQGKIGRKQLMWVSGSHMTQSARNLQATTKRIVRGVVFGKFLGALRNYGSQQFSQLKAEDDLQ